jgi:phosphinothricin acetyltransferase
MRLINCTFERHAAPILAILNEAIVSSTVLYDYQPRPPESMIGWFKTKEAGNFPVIGLESDAGELLGFASYGTFRTYPAFKYSVEHSVYVHHAHRGHGYGPMLLKTLIEEARRQGYHLLIGGIDTANEGSIALHTRLGFVHSGTITQAGFKFGRWLDLAFYQLTLETPLQPVDG